MCIHGTTDERVFQAVGALEPDPALEGKPGVSRKAIAKKLGKSEATVRRALERLVDSGHVFVTGTADKQRQPYQQKDQS